MVNGVPGKLSPVHSALLLWAIVSSKETGEPIRPLIDGDTELSREYAAALLSIADRFSVSLNTRTEKTLEKGMDRNFIEANVSRLNTSLSKNLGSELAERCKLASRSYGVITGYGLPVGLDIEIMEGDAP